ncbi:MAG: cohesin domain-containing protein [bacterium]|nr:cohesin domain-containing protein [bacterium]
MKKIEKLIHRFRKYPYKKQVTILMILAVAIVGTILFISSITSQKESETHTTSKAQEARIATVKTVELSLTSSKNKYAKGEEFAVQVGVNANNNKVTAADVIVTYPVESLEVLGVDASTFLPKSIMSPDMKPGVIHTIMGVLPKQAKTGKGTLFTVRFKVKTTSSASVKIDFQKETKVAAIGQKEDVVQTEKPLELTIQ